MTSNGRIASASLTTRALMSHRALCAVALTLAAILGETSRVEAQGFGAGRFGRFRGGAIVLPAEKADDEADEPSVVLPENGDMRRRLDLVRREIESEHYVEAARALGQFLQDAEARDFFLRHDAERAGGRSFLTEVRRLLAELPEEGKAAYRSEFEPAARARLSAAIARGGEAPLRETAWRFPETYAADEALYRLAQFLWDHGRIHAAADCLERLEGRHQGAPWAAGRARLLAACSARLGERSARGDDDWMTYRGNAARNRLVPAGAPFLVPRWSRPAAADAGTQLALERAWQAHRQGAATCLPLLSPLAVGELVFVRTARGVAAFDVATGDCRWRCPAEADDGAAGQNALVFQEPWGGAFSVDDECVYLLEDARLADIDARVSSENVLSAREHFRSREGNLRWQVGGADGGAEPNLAGAFFLGPPLSFQRRLYLLAEQKGALVLTVLDRGTGRQEWMQELALVEQPVAADPERLFAGASPSISGDEVIVCPTSGGAAVAVDLTTQSLLWAYRYPRHARQQPMLEDADPIPRLDQYERWLDGAVTIAQGRALLTPAESRDLHCVDLKSGKLLWTGPREDGMYIACATDAQVVVVGRKSVRALKLADGTEAWRVALPENSWPAGRGIFAADRYFLPVTAATLLEIDLRAGRLVHQHQSPRELPIGNLIWHGGLFVSQGPLALEAFDEREPLAARVRERIEQNPDDPQALVRQGELDLAAGQTLAAIAAFRKAHRLLPSPRTKTRLIAALLEGVKRKLPESAELSAELDAMIGP